MNPMLPNMEQIKSGVRWVLTTGGTLTGAYGAVSEDLVVAIAGLVALLIPLIWGMITHKISNAIAVVDAIAKQPESPVKGVVLESTDDGRTLAKSLPGVTTVTAGTPEAARLAMR